MIKTQDIVNLLSDNLFYKFSDNLSLMADKFAAEFNEASKNSCKRNLLIEMSYNDIKSFGKAREILMVELGGTNLNLSKIRVVAEDKVEVLATRGSDFYKEKVYTPEVLYTDIMLELNQFVSGDEKAKISGIVFVFSFPTDQFVREDGYVDGICRYFGKTRQSEGIIGSVVGIGLQNVLRANGYVNVNVSVTNDTPIYALAGKGESIVKGANGDGGGDVGMCLIVGTGMNIAAIYDDNIGDEGNFVKGMKIVNTESGDFKSVEMSEFDKAFDETQTGDSKGRYLTEKMVAGAWMHQIFKIILSAAQEKGIASKGLAEKFCAKEIGAVQIEAAIADQSLPTEDREIIETIWLELNKRGGSYCAALLAGIGGEIYKILGKELLNVKVCETGSMIRKGPKYKETLLLKLDELLAKRGLKGKLKFNFASPEEQASLGAAVFDSLFQK